MDHDQLKLYRQRWSLSQASLAAQMGLSPRQYQDLEAGKADMRPSHLQALEAISLAQAAEKGDPSLAFPNILRAAREIAKVDGAPDLVSVYAFERWDVAAQDNLRSRVKATPEAIMRIKAEAVRSTEERVPASAVDDEGFYRPQDGG